MDPAYTPLFIVMGVLLVLSGLASASETALFGIGRAKRAELASKSPALSRIIERLLASPRRLLLQVLLLNMATNVAYFIVSSVLTLRAETTAWRAAVSVGSVAAIILIGEILAKLAAVQSPDLCLRVLAPLQFVLRRPLAPIITLLDVLFITPATRLVTPSGTADRRVTNDEMRTLLELGADDGLIDQSEQDLLTAIVTLSNKRVTEIMRHRVDFAWVDIDDTRDEILQTCRDTGHTVFPVFDGGIDGTPLGAIDAKTVLSGAPTRDALRDVHFVPEHATIDDLLVQFKTADRSLALCVDEYGTVVGLITLTDIANELVGAPATSAENLENQTQDLGDGRWLVPGALSVRDWSAFFNVRGNATRANTIAGLIMHELGKLPDVGDEARIGQLTLKVHEMDNRRITRVEVRIEDAPPRSNSNEGGAP